MKLIPNLAGVREGSTHMNKVRSVKLIPNLASVREGSTHMNTIPFDFPLLVLCNIAQTQCRLGNSKLKSCNHGVDHSYMHLHSTHYEGGPEHRQKLNTHLRAAKDFS